MDRMVSPPPAYRDTALELLANWDRQQTAFIRHRDLRFDTILTTVERVCGRTPRILDLACGPGSLGLAARKRFPDAEIIGCDNPILLRMAHVAFAEDDKTSLLTVDLDHAEQVLALPGMFDAVISSTALHWLQPGKLSELYLALADKVRPGGVFLNGDHFLYDAMAQPSFRQLALDDDKAQQAAEFAKGVDDWETWWSKAAAAPGFEDAAIARAEVWKDKLAPARKVSLAYHQAALRSAGFSEVGSVWQYLDDWVVAAIR